MDITGIGAIFDFGSKIIDKIFPNKDAADAAKLRMFELQQQGEFEGMKQDFALAIEQLKVNAVESANPSVFVAGWRPAVGWVCVSAYAYNYVVMPLMNWCGGWYAAVAGVATPPLIALDTGELTTLLFGMLGIGTLRTIEKVKNANCK